MSQALIAALQNPALYPHPVGAFELIETHISWVILTGEYAYKIKKPVNFGFLDFTTLSARQHFCQEELRLNKRLAEALYLEVVPITGSETAPALGGDEAPIDYAVKMRQFPQSQLLNTLQAHGELGSEHIDAMAQQIAAFHEAAPRVPVELEEGSPESAMAPVVQNFEQVRPFLADAADLAQLEALKGWASAEYDRLLPLLQARKADGFIRECHGDLHLGNATLIQGKVVIFDCIEFNDPFRMTDVYADVAFLAMDLEDRGLKCLSRRFISRYLELTGDYAGLPLLNFYKAYRAMVRAKVALFSMPANADGLQRATALRQYRNYATLAEGYSAIPSRFLAITSGVSAVGKSHVALRLVEGLGAIRLRSDIERKRMFTAAEQQDTEALYSELSSEATYDRLHGLALNILAAGLPVVIDATYLKQPQRADAQAVAQEQGVPFIILDCNAPRAVIESWLSQRQANQLNPDPSDATLEVIAAQEQGRDPLTAEELLATRQIATHDAHSVDTLLDTIRQRLPGL